MSCQAQWLQLVIDTRFAHLWLDQEVSQQEGGRKYTLGTGLHLSIFKTHDFPGEVFLFCIQVGQEK
jgi:hypothetical protein